MFVGVRTERLVTEPDPFYTGLSKTKKPTQRPFEDGKPVSLGTWRLHRVEARVNLRRREECHFRIYTEGTPSI